MPELPVRRYFTIEELADYWGRSDDDVLHYIKEFGLRLAIRLKGALTLRGDAISAEQVMVRNVDSSQVCSDEWLYICEAEHVELSESALLVGEAPGYFHPDFDKWVDDPVNRVSIEDFSHEKLEVISKDTLEILELQSGDASPVIPLEEVSRFESSWDESRSASDSISEREKETLHRVIALLALELIQKDRRARHGEPEDNKPNFKGIAEIVHKHLPEGEKMPTSDTIRRKISEAFGSLFS